MSAQGPVCTVYCIAAYLFCVHAALLIYAFEAALLSFLAWNDYFCWIKQLIAVITAYRFSYAFFAHLQNGVQKWFCGLSPVKRSLWPRVLSHLSDWKKHVVTLTGAGGSSQTSAFSGGRKLQRKDSWAPGASFGPRSWRCSSLHTPCWEAEGEFVLFCFWPMEDFQEVRGHLGKWHRQNTWAQQSHTRPQWIQERTVALLCSCSTALWSVECTEWMWMYY